MLNDSQCRDTDYRLTYYLENQVTSVTQSFINTNV